MALPFNFGLVEPCHTSNYHKSKLPLYSGLNYDYKYTKNQLVPIVNYKKENANLINSRLHDHNYNNAYPADGYYERIRKYSECMFLQQHSPNQSASISKPPSNLESYLKFMEGILEMSRLQNLVPTMILVFVGGWIGGGRSVEALMRHDQVWIATGCSTIICVASMLVNDIFDFRSGTDQANGKTSPLLRGQVHPYHVELVASCLYGASVIGLCYLEAMSLRLLIGVIAVATYIYTPILKHLTLVKNVVVSGIVSSSILVGALAIGGKEQLQNPVVIAVALFFFLCVLSREILMDVGDMVGDKAAGVNTLAVRFGGLFGTLTASFFLAAANALLISLLAVKAQAFATIGTLILLPLHAKMLALCKELGDTKEVFSVKSIHKIVKQSMVHIGFGLLVLASAV